MQGFLSKIKNVPFEIPFKVISGGIFFSWSIQIISHIKLKDKELLEVLTEEYDRLLLTAVIGSFVFSAFYFAIIKLNNEKLKTNLIDLLGNFNSYLIYIFLAGGNLALFFGILFAIAALFLGGLVAPKFRPTSTISDQGSILIAVLIIGYFSVFELLYEGQSDFFEITKTIGSLSFLSIPLLFIRRKRLYVFFLILFLFVHALPSLYHLYTFGSRMPQSVYYAIMESPKAEMLEYISSKFDLKILVLMILVVLFPVLLTFLIKPTKERTTFTINSHLVAIIVFLLIYSFAKGNIRNNILFGYYQNFKDYSSKIQNFNTRLEKRNKRNTQFEGLKDNNRNENCTFILVIGESTGRNHMSLYDYYRPTNPKLQSIKNELFLFKDVISPHSHTQAVLEKVLTFANFENMAPLFEEGTLIELFKQAGFKTYWLSNQFFLGKNDHIVGAIAKTCDQTLFVNDDETISARSYDERLLKPLDKVLNDRAKKKFIVLHLLGTHDKYSKRYPPAFNFFNAKNIGDIPTKHRSFLENGTWAREKINEYDNAVLYNDDVIFNIINKTKACGNASYVLYFSDHGEDVYDSRPYFSHQENDATPFMFEIPFIVWFSNEYQNQWRSKVDSMSKYTSRKYQTDDLIHSIIDISNIELKRYNACKSIFDVHFKEEKRYMSGHDYDSLAPMYEMYRFPLKKP